MPHGLRAATAALALCLPLSALQVVLTRHAPWWRLPYGLIGWISGPTLVLILFLGWLLVRGRRIGLYATTLLGAIWFGLSAWSAIRMQNISLGFFSLFLGAYLLGVLSWLRFELGRSYFDPGVRWFEGLPRPIAGLDCELVTETGRIPYRVSRLDREGAFLFRHGDAETEPQDGSAKGALRDLVFNFRNQQIQCKGTPIRRLKREGEGVGIRFQDMTADARKGLGDFVESLSETGLIQ